VVDTTKVGNEIRLTAVPVAVVPALSDAGIVLMLILLAGAGVMFMEKWHPAGGAAA
jgi:hypothetical protein